MGIKNFVVSLTTVLLFCLCSCSKDEDGGFAYKDNQENVVEIKVYSNSPGVPIELEGVGSGYLTIKDYWETKFVTKNWGVGFVARCNDQSVLIKGEIYVNGDLMQKIEANSRLHMFVKIK